MLRPGQTMVNPILGHHITFVTTSENAVEDEFVFDMVVPTRSETLYQDHFHLEQEQRVEVISGHARYRLDGVDHEATVGDLIIFPVATSHVDPWNVGDEDLRLRVTFSPAGNVEASFEMVKFLIESGQVPESGNLNLVQNAMLLQKSGFQTYMAGVPVPVQRVSLFVLSLIGRLRGYRVDEKSSPIVPRATVVIIALALIAVAYAKLQRNSNRS